MNRILIVEDEKMIRSGIRIMIENSDVPYRLIEECRNGKEAEEYLKSTDFDLVLTDIRMPVMDGVELADWMKRHFGEDEMPLLVAISGYAEFDYVRSVMKDGALDYLLKPIDREELVKVLWSAEKKCRERKQLRGAAEEGDEEEISFVSGEKMREAVEYILKNYKRPIDMTEVSNQVSMNYTMFSSEFKKYTGLNFTAYLKRLRIEKAKKLLLTTDLKLNEVGISVGVENARGFARIFREETGMTPSVWREQKRKIDT